MNNKIAATAYCTEARGCYRNPWKWDLVCEELIVHDIVDGLGEDELDELVFRIWGAPTSRCAFFHFRST
jgi:hypothetical protein